MPLVCFSGVEGLFSVTLSPSVFIQVHFKMNCSCTLPPFCSHAQVLLRGQDCPASGLLVLATVCLCCSVCTMIPLALCYVHASPAFLASCVLLTPGNIISLSLGGSTEIRILYS